MLDSNYIGELFFNCCPGNIISYALKNIQPQPLSPFIKKLYISQNNFGSVRKIYIECLKDKAIHILDQKECTPLIIA